jgi:hypothetical protein
MNASKHDDDTQSSVLVSWGWVNSSDNPPSTPHSPVTSSIHSPINSPISSSPISSSLNSSLKPPAKPAFDLFSPIRKWLDRIEVKDAEFAHTLCQRIPSQCPFERRVQFRGRTLLYIPPLCKLNPVYDEVVALRFRALCYLADVCGEDISAYC